MENGATLSGFPDPTPKLYVEYYPKTELCPILPKLAP